MPGFLTAHGYDPGPTQRPLLAGAITGVLASIPAIGMLYGFGSLGVEARILGLSELVTMGAGCGELPLTATGVAPTNWLL